MNRHKLKTAKIILGLNLGLYHHMLNSCCPSKGAILNRLVVKHGSSVQCTSQHPAIILVWRSLKTWRLLLLWPRTSKFITDITGFMLMLSCYSHSTV